MNLVLSYYRHLQKDNFTSQFVDGMTLLLILDHDLSAYSLVCDDFLVKIVSLSLFFNRNTSQKCWFFVFQKFNKFLVFII